jgi:hypothetical protein
MPALELRQNPAIRWSVLAALAAVFLLPAVAFGQPGPSRRGGERGRGQPQPRQPDAPPISANPEGSLPGFILGYTPAQDEKNVDLVGYLRFKPVEKNGRTLKLAVHRMDDLKITIGTQDIPIDEAQEYFIKGLYCTVEWGLNRDSRDKSAKSELRSLRMEEIEVTGTIDSIDGDLIVIKAKPKSGDPWPTVETGTPSASASASATPARKLKLKVLPDLTVYTDPNDEPLDAADFEAEQSVDANIIFGRSQLGMILTLRRPGPRTATATQQRRVIPEQPAGRGKRAAGG